MQTTATTARTGVSAWLLSLFLFHWCAPVAGVAWDPLNQFIATESSDRSCRVYASGRNPQGEIFGPVQKGKWSDVKCCKVIRNRTAPTPAGRSGKASGKEEAVKSSTGVKPEAPAGAGAGAGAGAPAPADAEDTPAGAFAVGAPPPAAAGTSGGDAAGAAADSAPPSEAEAKTTASSSSGQQPSTDNDVGGGGSSGSGDGSSSTSGPAQHVLYMDETVPNFFRRLCFSPDGEFLFTPTGCFRSLDGDAQLPQARLEGAH